MAYSNVGTPVFYVDNYLYHKTIGTSFESIAPYLDYSNINPESYPSIFNCLSISKAP